MSSIDFRFDYMRSFVVDRVTGRPILDPGTGAPLERYDPYIPCVISSRSGKKRKIDGLLDSGSDATVIPRRIADYLELELQPARSRMMVADGVRSERYVSKASLIIGRGGRFSDPIQIEVTVPAEGDPPVLIGRDPVFRHYAITFIEAEKRLEMKGYLEKSSQILS